MAGLDGVAPGAGPQFAIEIPGGDPVDGLLHRHFVLHGRRGTRRPQFGGLGEMGIAVDYLQAVKRIMCVHGLVSRGHSKASAVVNQTRRIVGSRPSGSIPARTDWTSGQGGGGVAWGLTWECWKDV